MDNFVFAPEDEVISNNGIQVYKMLVVDDDETIHNITNTAVKTMSFRGFDLEILSAYSGEEAKEILAQHDDVAVALVDVVMETNEAGLNLIDYIRNDIQNTAIRLVIRTGQAHKFPSMQVIDDYDIKDFKEKTELTVERLYITIRSAIREYNHLVELEHKYEDTYHHMITNQLTNLPNRIKLYEDFTANAHNTLVLIDIIGFSVINETNGYEIGDYVLQELGGFLQTMYSDEFTVYHLDSDLFGLLAVDIEFDHLVQKVETIKDDISRMKIVTDNFNKTIDTTIGVAYQSDTDLMRKAELALKEARRTGKNKIKYYSDDLKVITRLDNTNHWAPIIKEALQDGSLVAYYQPIVHTDTKEIEKYELLVRIHHDGKVHSPFAFLEAAEHSGQLFDIFKYMFKQACIQSSRTGKKFSVNISNLEFSNESLIPYIKDTLKEHDTDPSTLSLEILETSAVVEEDIIAVINEIHKIGIKIIVDDFGVQCSNFGQIENLPIDVLKIDGSFIRNLPTSKNSQVIVDTIKTFATGKELDLVAEFVCDEDVYEKVKELGIKYSQGYYLGEPRPSI